MNIDDTLRFLDRVAMRQIVREKIAGGSEEEEGSDAVQQNMLDSEQRAERQPSRVFTDASEDPVIEQVSGLPGVVVCEPGERVGWGYQMAVWVVLLWWSYATIEGS